MSEILLGSETWEITVTCSGCGRTEIMYVPIANDVGDVQRFLYGRGWTSSGHVWLCGPEDCTKPEGERGKDVLVSWAAIDKLRDTYPPSPGSDMNAVDYFLREVVGDR